MLARDADLLIKREPDRIDDRIRQVVDDLQRAAVVLQTARAVTTPVERINSELESISDSNFELFANEDIVPTGAVRPRDRIFEFNTPRSRCRRFVQKSEMPHARERRSRPQHQYDNREL